MCSFIKFFDSKGFLIALSCCEGIVKYITHQGKQIFPYFHPNGQSIALVLKSPHLLLDAFRYFNGSVGDSSACRTMELETIHNTFITAHFSPTNMYASPIAARDASSLENYASQANFPSSPPSSLAQAFQSRSQVHEIQCEKNNTSSSMCDEEDEMSFNECFDNAAVECR